MNENIYNWDGKKIAIARSKQDRIAVLNYKDNLIITEHSIWPHPNILKKLHKSNHEKDFENSAIKQELGFYCDLQSLTSEDAITWSVFGILSYFTKAEQIRFVNSLLSKIGIGAEIKDCLISLWTKIAHPDTAGLGGPELDFLIIGDKVVLFGESKWKSEISQNQGKDKNKDQLQLRVEFLQKYGKKIFPNMNSL